MKQERRAPPSTPQDVQAETGVSDDVMARLETYADTLHRWQPRVNLVSASTLDDLWRRHMLDSLQLLPLLPTDGERVLVDLGSGAGFPGLVLAIASGLDTHLIESDSRKAAFLREVIRLTGARARVHVARIEAVPPILADVVTARALAPLPKLFDYAERFLKPGAVCLFLKGERAEQELTESGKTWKITVDAVPSRSDPTGVVLRIHDVKRQDVR